MKKVLLIALLIFAFSSFADAQFNSGSTGADGALDLSTMTCPNNVCEVQLPESGILNYTTVNVPSNLILLIKRNSSNTPVIILAQGNVNISGIVDVSAPQSPSFPSAGSNLPGPGGFYGGNACQPGFGPGGGGTDGSGGRWVGPLSLVPIVGGSGGGGYSSSAGCSVGGGGGGAILIASSGAIIMVPSGRILANKGCSYANGGSCGSGGAIRIVASSVNVAGLLMATGNTNGVIRIEAPDGQRFFTGTSQPAAVLSTINPNIVSNSQSQLTIQSVGGYTVPSYAGTRFDTVDLLLPNQLTDPVNVVVRANNIPVGTTVNVGFVSGSLSGTSTPCNLAGTEASSQCTATISNLNRTGVTYLLATASFTPPASVAQFNPKGENQVAKIRLDSVLGAKPKYVFLRSDNSVIETGKLQKSFLQYFGM